MAISGAGSPRRVFSQPADAGQKVVGEALFEEEPNLVDPAMGTIKGGHVTTRSAQETLKNSPGRFTSWFAATTERQQGKVISTAINLPNFGSHAASLHDNADHSALQPTRARDPHEGMKAKMPPQDGQHRPRDAQKCPRDVQEQPTIRPNLRPSIPKPVWKRPCEPRDCFEAPTSVQEASMRRPGGAR